MLLAAEAAEAINMNTVMLSGIAAIVTIFGSITSVILALIKLSADKAKVSADGAADKAKVAAEEAKEAAVHAKEAAVITGETAVKVDEIKSLVNGSHTKMEERFEALTAELKQANEDKAKLQADADAKGKT